MKRTLFASLCLMLGAATLALVPVVLPSARAEEKEQPLTIDHYVRVQSIVPSMSGNRMTSTQAPAAVPANGAPFNTQSHDEFMANWDRQVVCPNQYDPAASDSVWKAMMESDPVGATWGTGVRRAPSTTNWGWSTAVVSRMQTPVLMVSGVGDKQVDPKNVSDLYADLGATQKVLINMGCASHNAMWERGHLILFKASLEWLSKGTVDGQEQGILKMGSGN